MITNDNFLPCRKCGSVILEVPDPHESYGEITCGNCSNTEPIDDWNENRPKE